MIKVKNAKEVVGFTPNCGTYMEVEMEDGFRFNLETDLDSGRWMVEMADGDIILGVSESELYFEDAAEIAYHLIQRGSKRPPCKEIVNMAEMEEKISTIPVINGIAVWEERGWGQTNGEIAQCLFDRGAKIILFLNWVRVSVASVMGKNLTSVIPPWGIKGRFDGKWNNFRFPEWERKAAHNWAKAQLNVV